MMLTDERCSFLSRNSESDRTNTDFAHLRNRRHKIIATTSE